MICSARKPTEISASRPMCGALLESFLCFSGCRYRPRNAFFPAPRTMRCSFVENTLFEGREARPDSPAAAPLIRLPLYIGRRPDRIFLSGPSGAVINDHSLFFNELGQCERSLASALKAKNSAAHAGLSRRRSKKPLFSHPGFLSFPKAFSPIIIEISLLGTKRKASGLCIILEN